MRQCINIVILIIMLFSFSIARCTEKKLIMPDVEEPKTEVEWTLLSSGTGNTLTKIFFLNENTGWIFGKDNVVLKTENGGNNWTSINSNILINYYDICFINQNDGWILGNEKGQLFILKSVDGGDNWNHYTKYIPNNGLGDLFNKIQFVDIRTGWIITQEIGVNNQNPSQILFKRSIRQSRNGGYGWNVQYEETLDGNDDDIGFHSMCFLNKNIGWVSGCFIVLKTEDGGTNWIKQDIPAPPQSVEWSHFWDIHFVDLNTGFLASSEAGMLKTTDGGASWNYVFNGSIVPIIRTINFYDTQLGAIAGDRIYITLDGGNTWQLVYQNDEHFFNNLCFANNQSLFAVGEDGVIVKISVGDATAVTYNSKSSTAVPGQTHLYQNYPNPFNPETVIEYDIHEKTHVTITVSDILGHTIKTLINAVHSRGKYSATWDGKDTAGKHVTSGIYFYKIKTDQYEQVRKMTLTR